MARSERNDVDYFPHPVTHGKNMFIIDTKFGNDGYVVWFRTLEALGKTDFHHIDLSDETRVLYMASLCNVEEDRYLEIISLLVKLGEFHKEIFQERAILWNQKFISSIQDAYRKRSNDCITLEELLEMHDITGITPECSGAKGDNSGGLQQTKLKDTTVKDSVGHQEFYKKEFKKCKENKDRNIRNGYFRFIGTIYNSEGYENALGSPAKHILEIPNQLGLDEYIFLKEAAKKRGINLLSKLKRIINDPGYTKGKQSIALLLEDWILKEPIQGTNH